MDIRYVNEEDSLYEISHIYESSWKYAYKGIIPQSYLDSIPEGRWATGITRKGMHNLVMTDDGRLIGTAAFCRSRWKKYSDYGEIVSIYFLPEYIGKGYGTPLLKKCIEELEKLGYTKVLLWVLEDNLRARRFYEKNGFIFSGEYMNDNIGGKDIKEVLYTFSCDEQQHF